MEVIVRISGSEGFSVPEYQTTGSAGADLRACLDTPIEIHPGDRRLVPTGLRVEVPAGFEAQVRPRSGLAFKNGITVLNSPGTIDSDYRGEVGVVLHNAGKEIFVVQHGDRIAQLVVAPVCRATFEMHSSLTETDRGSGGYGSTGTA
jgi:dUTP pyrophosphatase